VSIDDFYDPEALLKELRSPRISAPYEDPSGYWGSPPHVVLALTWWDNSSMAISTVDEKQRVVLPAARPGDVFDIQSQGEGSLLLVCSWYASTVRSRDPG
jgi:hypothetical protein